MRPGRHAPPRARRGAARDGRRAARPGPAPLVCALLALPGAALGLEPAHLDLGSVRPGTLEVQAEGREVLVVFDAPLSAAEAGRLSGLSGPLIEGVTLGGDALRLRLAAPSDARLTRRDGRSTVLITPRPGAAPAEDWEERRLLTLEARALARGGDPAGARERLAGALRDRPEDVDLLTALASIEEQAGQWRAGLSLYDRALSGDPGAEEVARARAALGLRFGPSVRADGFAAFAPGGERIQGAVVRGDTPLGPGWRADFSAETRHGEADDLRRRDGLDGGAFDVARARGEIGLAREWSGAAVTRLGLHGADGGPGLSVQHRLAWAPGATTFSGDWRRPYWDTLTSLQRDAGRDGAALRHDFLPLPGLVAQAGAGWARYGVPSRRDVADGPTAEAGLTWTLPRAMLDLGDWTPRLGYRFAAEYLGRVGAATPGGLPLLDVRRREVHAAQASLDGSLGPGLLTVVGGYAHDRYGGGGPLASLRYARGAEDRLSFGVEAGVGPSLAEPSRAVWRVGAFLVWRLGVEAR